MRPRARTHALGEADMTEDVILRSSFEQARGVIGRYPEQGQRVVFEFDEVAPRVVHMLGVRRPLSVEWWIGDERERTETLRAWTGIARADADTIIETRP